MLVPQAKYDARVACAHAHCHHGAHRQYAVIDLQRRAAGFTGTSTQAWTGDTQTDFGSFTYSAQGNILTSERVINQTSTGFESGGCDLADRLMRALEAGAENGEGDTRCTRSSARIPSDSAFIQVSQIRLQRTCPPLTNICFAFVGGPPRTAFRELPEPFRHQH